jgi:uncharacterized protein (TIGR03382 family)
MLRAVLLATLLAPCLARAHAVSFDFVFPSGIGTHTDGGFTALQWVDGADPNGLATLTFYASRTGLPPFAAAPRDVPITTTPINVNDPANVVAWDATQVPPGCYQPFAVMHDSIEGETSRLSAGVVTVVPADGGNVPPAIWILNLDFEKPQDGGMFALRLKIDDPDDVGEVALRWTDGADAGGTLVAGLPTNDGGGTLTYAFNARALPPADIYYLQAEVTAFDGQQCAIWWSGNLPGNAPKDAGMMDAGEADGGVNPPLMPKGCGCSQGAGPLGLLALGWLLRRRR